MSLEVQRQGSGFSDEKSGSVRGNRGGFYPLANHALPFLFALSTTIGAVYRFHCLCLEGLKEA